ncbi:hypothetical protein SAMN06265350_10440 [Solitalea koreensis]|uniref:Lysylphosphatidylglycerol synthase TM region n=2 Tax=Solitalea koreensis TaxID=543615 RepID=A0A521CGB7_9SPHI|nr:hypothetical protein SAMN06265350_10440 [Solitalea koreensis]
MLYFAFKGQDIHQLTTELKQANYFWVSLAAAVTLLAHLVRAARWNMLIKPLGHSPKLLHTFNAVIIGYMANLAFPRLGEVSRCGTLTKTDDIAIDKLIGTVIVERVIDLLSLIVILLLTVLLQFRLISSFIYDNLLKGIVEKLESNQLLLLGIGILGLISIIALIFIYRRYKLQLMSSVLGQKIILLFSGISKGLTSIAMVESKVLFIAYTVLLWFLYLLSTYIMFFAIPATSSLTFLTGLFVLTVGSLGMAAPVQGGIGAFHWIVSKGLVLYKISEAEGLVYATISHGTQTLMVILVGALGLAYILVSSNHKVKADV